MSDRSDLAIEILHNAKKKHETGKPLSQVEQVVLREWLVILKSNLDSLELKEQHQMISDIELAEKIAIAEKIRKYGEIT